MAKHSEFTMFLRDKNEKNEKEISRDDNWQAQGGFFFPLVPIVIKEFIARVKGD